MPYETRSFHDTISKAKRKHLKNGINGVKDDKELYRVINWCKLAINLKSFLRWLTTL